MATVPRNSLDSLKRWHTKTPHPVWVKSFNLDQQKQLLDDDLSASYTVAAVLVSVVVLGFLLIGGTTLISVLL